MEYTRVLRLNKEFRRLYYQGRYKPHPKVVTYCLKNSQNEARIGITTGKKIGNAVTRNRARRILSAAYRAVEKQLDLKGYDFVFVARKDIIGARSTELEKILFKQIAYLTKQKKNAGIIENQETICEKY